MKTRFLTVVGSVIAALTVASVALAQAPSAPTYGGVGPTIDEQVAGGVAGGGVAGDVVMTGTLPFTGFDVAVAFGVGLMLVAVGFATRRLAHARD